MAETPPDKYLPNWADGITSKGLVNPSLSKQAEGYRTGEAPGAQHLNFLFNRVCNWNEVHGRSLAAPMAFRNIDHTGVSSFSNNSVSNHITYDALADHWYCVKTLSGAQVYAYDSADGETWSGATFVANAGSSPYYGDVSKAVTNGTNVAICVDDTVYYSSDLTVANLDAGTVVNAAFVECSDLVWDEGNSLWIVCGRSSTKGVIWTATVPTGTWTLRRTAGTDTDYNAMATDGEGNTAVIGSGGVDSCFSSTGTGWSAATTDPAQVMNNIAWAPSLQLFLGLGNANNYLHTSTNGDVWRDQNAIRGVPALHNIAHCPDFFLAWSDPVTSANGVDVCSVYAFPTVAVDADTYDYSNIGKAWGETIPRFQDQYAIMHGGQGKLVYLYDSTWDYLAVARYGAA